MTVIGAMSRIFLNFNGGGPRFCTGDNDVNSTTDWPAMPSINRLAFAENSNEIKVKNDMVPNLEIVKLYDGSTTTHRWLN